MEDPVHPHQKPAYTKAQQKSQHQIDLLLGYIVSHKVVLRGVHHRLVPVIRNNVMDVMPVAGNRNGEKHQRRRAKRGVFFPIQCLFLWPGADLTQLHRVSTNIPGSRGAVLASCAFVSGGIGKRARQKRIKTRTHAWNSCRIPDTRALCA